MNPVSTIPVEGSLPTKKFRIPKDVWAAIKEAYEQGVPASVLEERFCVLEATIVQESHKKGWIQPTRYVKEVIRQVDFLEKNSTSPPAIRDWVDAATRYRSMIFNKVEAAVAKANVESPKSWRDLEIADRIARKASGLESGETTVVQTIIPIGSGTLGVERDVSPDLD